MSKVSQVEDISNNTPANEGLFVRFLLLFKRNKLF